MVRAAAKIHRVHRDRESPATVRRRSSPRSRATADRRAGMRSARSPSRRSATPPRTTRGSLWSCPADGCGRRSLPDEPGLPGASDPYPATLTIPLEKVETLRYGENPHQPGGPLPPAGARRRGRSRSRSASLPAGQGAVVQQRPRRVRRGLAGSGVLGGRVPRRSS